MLLAGGDFPPQLLAMLCASRSVLCSLSALFLCSVVLLMRPFLFLFYLTSLVLLRLPCCCAGCAARLVAMSRKRKALSIKRKSGNCTEIGRKPEEEMRGFGTQARFASVNAQHYCRSARGTSKECASFRPWCETSTRCEAWPNGRHPAHMVGGS